MVVRNFSLASDYHPWGSNAKAAFQKIVDAGKVEEFEEYFNKLFPNGVVSVRDINFELARRDEEILEHLGIADDEEEEDEEI